jgi:putative acetyltransferase
MQYPAVLNPAEVGNYPASCFSGGGFVWDAVLEYRVWCHPERGAPDEADGNDYFYAFETFEEADAFARATMGAEEPLALVLQREYIDEDRAGMLCACPGAQNHRMAGGVFDRPQRDDFTIPDFLERVHDLFMEPVAPQKRQVQGAKRSRAGGPASIATPQMPLCGSNLRQGEKAALVVAHLAQAASMDCSARLDCGFCCLADSMKRS